MKLLQLGDELLCKILAFLDIKSIARAERSCRSIRRLAAATVWEDLEAARTPRPEMRSRAATIKERVVRFGLASEFAASMRAHAQSHYRFSSDSAFILRGITCPDCPHLPHAHRNVFENRESYEYLVRFTDSSNNENVIWEGYLPGIGRNSSLNILRLALDPVLESHSDIFLRPNGELQPLAHVSLTVVAQSRDLSLLFRPLLVVTTACVNVPLYPGQSRGQFHTVCLYPREVRSGFVSGAIANPARPYLRVMYY